MRKDTSVILAILLALCFLPLRTDGQQSGYDAILVARTICTVDRDTGIVPVGPKNGRPGVSPLRVGDCVRFNDSDEAEIEIFCCKNGIALQKTDMRKGFGRQIKVVRRTEADKKEELVNEFVIFKSHSKGDALPLPESGPHEGASAFLSDSLVFVWDDSRASQLEIVDGHGKLVVSFPLKVSARGRFAILPAESGLRAGKRYAWRLDCARSAVRSFHILDGQTERALHPALVHLRTRTAPNSFLAERYLQTVSEIGKKKSPDLYWASIQGLYTVGGNDFPHTFYDLITCYYEHVKALPSTGSK